MDVKVKTTDTNQQQFTQDVIEGLSRPQKTLPCKYFYDAEGSNLFEEICELDEYYVTRAELALLEQIESELVELIGKNAIIIEPGAGAGIKIKKLLHALNQPQTYVPIDISADFLFESAEKVKSEFPKINVLPLQGDFTQALEWHGARQQTNRLVFFPGSTIGNFTPDKAVEFLKNQAKLAGEQGKLLIGFDLVKPIEKLVAAYNDKKGITEQFNKNLLVRINNELDGDFDIDSFEHDARFNPHKSRIEMHLVSKVNQFSQIDEHQFEFKAGETIHTENSYKYTHESFLTLAEAAGLKPVKHWTDSKQRVALHFLAV
ncbi:L-histidine N(alpha)-methyltransferase [Aliikangiella sp. IMCC44653]